MVGRRRRLYSGTIMERTDYDTRPYPVRSIARRQGTPVAAGPAEPASVLFFLEHPRDVEPLRRHRWQHRSIAFRPTWCFDLEEGLLHLRRSPYDAVVAHVASRARRRDPLDRLFDQHLDLPLVVLSAQATRDIGHYALERGALAHLAIEDLEAPFLSLCLFYARIEHRLEQQAHGGSDDARIEPRRVSHPSPPAHRAPCGRE